MEYLFRYQCLLWSVFLFMRVAAGASQKLSNSTHILYKTLLDNYIPDIRPCLDCSTPLFVGIKFHLTALNKIDEIEGELSTVGYLKVVWEDERLTWDPSSNGVGYIMMPSTKIWTPTILLGNPSKEIIRLNQEDAIARVLYNGTVIWHPGDVFRSRCQYDVHSYPFDKQSCWIVLTPWSYLASEITFLSTSDNADTEFYHENGKWKLGPTSSSTYTKKRNSFVRFHFNFIRRSEFFVVNIIVPISILSFLNCLAFAIPIESGERVSYSITVLLSFAVFMTLVSDNIPKTSAPMSLLCYYLTSLFSGSVLIMTCVMINMRMFYTDPNTSVPLRYVRLYKMVSKSKWRKDLDRRRKSELNCVRNDTHQGVQNGCDADRTAPDVPVTWSDVATVFDKIGLIISVIYFSCITIGLISYTTKSNLYD